jgi:hypothetical protein
MGEYLANLIHAKPSAHALAFAMAFVGIMYHEFAKQPQFDRWLTAHWIVATLISSVKVAAPVFAVYFPSLKRAA